ncbi:hypothetical protein KQ310_13385 [Synechococcus sp. CS-1328]|nr:hypothetical protein [Synechococcus sp. CS-1328]
MESGYTLGGFSDGDSAGVFTTDGQEVFLYLNDGVVEGRTDPSEGNAAVAFTLSVTGSGMVTLDQQRSLKHSNTSSSDESIGLALAVGAAITLTRADIIVDSDGDQSTDTAILDITSAIAFRDDGPQVLVSSAAPPKDIIVDETDLGTNASVDFSDRFVSSFQYNYGADGHKPESLTTTYSLDFKPGVSGLVDSVNGQNVSLQADSSSGRVEGVNEDGDTVFTLEVNSDGVVTLDQLRAVEHSPDSGPDQSTTLTSADLISLTRTDSIQDADGDLASNSVSLDIGTSLVFKDDAPQIDATSPAGILENEVNATTSGSYTLDIGADAADFDAAIELIWNNEASGYSLVRDPVLGSDGSVKYTAVSDSNPSSQLFTVVVSPPNETGQGTYSFTLLDPAPAVVKEVTNLFDYFANNSSPNEQEVIDANSTGRDGTNPPFSDGLFDLLIEGGSILGSQINHPQFPRPINDRTDGDLSVKISSTDLGVGSNTVQRGEYLLFDVVEKEAESVEFTELTIGFAATAGFSTDRTQVGLTLFYKDGSTSTSTNNVSGRPDGGGTLTIEIPPVDKPVDYITVAALTTNFKIDGFGFKYEAAEKPDDYEYLFSLEATDADGDSVVSDMFGVRVDGNQDGQWSVTPVVLDIHGDGVEYLSIDAGVRYDYDGDGYAEQTAWVAPTDAILYYDANGNINDGVQIAFGRTVGETDLEGIKAVFDSNVVIDSEPTALARPEGSSVVDSSPLSVSFSSTPADASQVGDGYLTAADSHFANFGIWTDVNSDGVIQEGEYQSLQDAGIVSIDLTGDAPVAGALGQEEALASGDVVLNATTTYVYEVTNPDGTSSLLTGHAEDVSFSTVIEQPSDNTPPQAADAPETSDIVSEDHAALTDDVPLSALIDDALAHPELLVSDPAHTTPDSTGMDDAVVIPADATVQADVHDISALVDQLVAENPVTDDHLAEYQHEITHTDPSLDTNLDTGFDDGSAGMDSTSLDGVHAADTADSQDLPQEDPLAHHDLVVDDGSIAHVYDDPSAMG